MAAELRVLSFLPQRRTEKGVGGGRVRRR